MLSSFSHAIGIGDVLAYCLNIKPKEFFILYHLGPYLPLFTLFTELFVVPFQIYLSN